MKDFDCNLCIHMTVCPAYMVTQTGCKDYMPQGNVIPVVRCEDCRHARPLNRRDSYEDRFIEDCVWCMMREDGVFPEGYCSDGERREADARPQ